MSTATEDEIISTLEDLRGLKRERKELANDLKDLENQIEGLDDDIESAEGHLKDLITQFTEANPDKIPSFF